MINDHKLKELSNYYKDKDLAIIGLNDLQGADITSIFSGSNLLSYIKKTLQNEQLSPIIIDGFFLTMNKMEHIDYLLKCNLSLEEIKLAQIYSTISELEKILEDHKMPKGLGKFGNVYKLINRIQKCDKSLFITDTLRNIAEPTVIYSSGYSSLMSEIGCNPNYLQKDYKLRNKKPNYNYILEKINDTSTLSIISNGIKTNFENILKINNKTDIYALGLYISKSLDKEELLPVKRLIIDYNNILESLCEKYHITYINTELIGKKYIKSGNKSYINKEGHYELALQILDKMYDRKINLNSYEPICLNSDFTPNNYGPSGMEITANWDKLTYGLLAKEQTDNYSAYRELEKSKEHEREEKIFKKVKEKSSTVR